MLSVIDLLRLIKRWWMYRSMSGKYKYSWLCQDKHCARLSHLCTFWGLWRETQWLVARSVFAGCLEVPTAKHHSAIFVQGSKGHVSRRVTLMSHMFTQKKRGSLKLWFIIRYFFSFFFFLWGKWTFDLSFWNNLPFSQKIIRGRNSVGPFALPLGSLGPPFCEGLFQFLCLLQFPVAEKQNSKHCDANKHHRKKYSCHRKACLGTWVPCGPRLPPIQPNTKS